MTGDSSGFPTQAGAASAGNHLGVNLMIPSGLFWFVQ